jgi:hypothetical protein
VCPNPCGAEGLHSPGQSHTAACSAGT